MGELTQNQQAENKMGTRPILPLLLSMAFPAMLSMLIQSLYNVVDSIFVAQLGENALTAVSLAFPVQNLILAVGLGTGVGMNSLIARRLGEKQVDEADSIVTHGLIMAVFTAVLFLLFGIFFTRPFFQMFTSDPQVLKYGCDYGYIVTIFCFGTLIHIAIEKIFQATGNMILPMVFLCIGAITNIILDPIMIFGLLGFPRLEVAGAAIATVVGQIVAMLTAVIVFLTKEHEVRPKWRGFRFQWKTIKEIYAVGIPTMLMNSLSSVLITGLNGILMTFSQTAVSVFGVYFKLQSFVFMPTSGLTQGAMPIMGYNYGAKNKKRLMDTLKWSCLISFLIMAAGCLLFELFPAQLLRMFNASEDMLGIGVRALRIISISYLGAAFGFVFSTLFQAVGKGFYSLFVSLLRQLILILPVSYVLSKLIGLYGVWLSFPLAEIFAALFCVALFFHIRRSPDFQQLH